MPVFTPHTLVAFGGSLLGTTGKDGWQVGIRGGSFNSPAQAFGNSDAFIAQLYPVLSAWFSDPGSKAHPDAKLEWLKINDIGADGKYKEAVTHRHDYSPAIASGFPTRNAPAYMSLAYTWETGLARGLAHRGRIYFPNSWPIAKGSEVAAADAAANAAYGELLLSKIVNASDVATTSVDRFNPCVYSSKNGAYNRITGVSSDCLYDEQHRRKEQTVTTRSSVVVDYSTH